MQLLYTAEPAKAYRLAGIRPLGIVEYVGTTTLTVEVQLQRTMNNIS